MPDVWYYALSGLGFFPNYRHIGLHPMLTYWTLSGPVGVTVFSFVQLLLNISQLLGMLRIHD